MLKSATKHIIIYLFYYLYHILGGMLKSTEALLNIPPSKSH